MKNLLVRALALGVTVTLGLSGCSAPKSEIARNAAVTVAWSEPFFSYNAATTFGNTTANANIVYATNSRFAYYDDTATLVRDESFGTYEKLADEPLTVKYTVGENIVWSDGTPVDAVDLLLNWAALSGGLNTPGVHLDDVVDSETGSALADAPSDAVFFDSGQDPERPAGLGLASAVPEITDDGTSITVVYDRPFVDWELAMPGAGLPAHVIAAATLGVDDADDAKATVRRAIENNDTATLSAISAFWNTGFNFSTMPANRDLLVGNGPYVVSGFAGAGRVTLRANPAYAGDHTPRIGTVTVRFIPDPLDAIAALRDGEVDIVAPLASVEIDEALDGLEGIEVAVSDENGYEHLDLQFDRSKSGVFGDAAVREAFLKTVPRQAIVDELVSPVSPDARVLDSRLLLPGADGYESAVEENGSRSFAEVDIPGAESLLAAAGVVKPEVCILYSSEDRRRAAEFRLIQQSAAEAGFVVTDCSAPDWTVRLGVPGAYDAALFAWQASGLGATASSSVFRTDGVNNRNYYSNGQVDSLLDELDTEFDPKKQAALLADIDEILWDDAYGVPLYQLARVTAVNDRVANVRPSRLSPTIFWNVWEWSPTDVAAGAR